MYNIRTGYAACSQYARVHSGDRTNVTAYYYYYPFIIKRTCIAWTLDTRMRPICTYIYTDTIHYHWLNMNV